MDANGDNSAVLQVECLASWCHRQGKWLIFFLLLLSSWITSATVACGGSIAPIEVRTIDQPSVSLALPFQPSYLYVVSTSSDAFIYLEADSSSGTSAYAVHIDERAQPQSDVILLASNLSGHFGEVAGDGSRLMMAATYATDGSETDWELIMWEAPQPPRQVLRCRLPSIHHGQVFPDGDQVFVLFEDTDNTVKAFRVDLENPICPEPDRLVEVISPPLPSSYVLNAVGDVIVWSGRVGDSYSLRFIDPTFEVLRTVRFATGTASDVSDINVYMLGNIGHVALYTAQQDNAFDVYLTQLDQLAVSAAGTRRIVATGEFELHPELFIRQSMVVVNWFFFDEGSHELVELAAMLPDGDIAITGGEIISRSLVGTASMLDTAWSDSGSIQAMVEPSDGQEATLTLSLYRPSFWDSAGP